ncbi:hypothetical protein W909_04730 [Dickeya zeae EC1]|nr:hypothetical protein W909_04730 [Dickeya zeae EC1]
MTDGGFAGFADFLAGFTSLPVDKSIVVRSFAILKTGFVLAGDEKWMER